MSPLLLDPFPQIISCLGKKKKNSPLPLVGNGRRMKTFTFRSRKQLPRIPRAEIPSVPVLLSKGAPMGAFQGLAPLLQLPRDGKTGRGTGMGWQGLGLCHGGSVSPEFPNPREFPNLAPGQLPPQAVDCACPVSCADPFLSPLSSLRAIPGWAGASCIPGATRKKRQGRLSGLEKASGSRHAPKPPWGRG